MNLRELELARRMRVARMATAGACGGPECDDVPLAVRPVNPNIVPSLTPRNWWVESGLNADGTVRSPLTLPAGALFAGAFQINVPANYALWALNVNYTSADVLAVGMIQLGANNPPIRVLNGFPFDLDTVDFPFPLCGPVQVLIRAGSIAGDPVIPLPVTWYAIIGELSDGC